VADVKDHQVVKYLEPMKQRRSWSGKKKVNSYKLLSVMDHSGQFIFACVFWERMTAKYLPVAHYIYRRKNTFQMLNL
jgi:hypothetical protein